ncbi:MAG: hypothetical protein AAGE18_14345 [Pseudomonadota bacterium]
MSVVPSTYEDWKHCITVSCDIPLTPHYVAERIAALSDANDHHTKQFIKRWGEAHHKRTLAWFQQAAAELNS